MTRKFVEPHLGKSFNCPHCGALADQLWQELFAPSADHRFIPKLIDPADTSKVFNSEYEASESVRRFVERASRGDLLIFGRPDSRTMYQVVNLHISRCRSCQKFGVWRKDQLIWPSYEPGLLEPNDDLPEDIKQDFIEAVGIVDRSPRGAAALARLCVQKICKHLGHKGENINADIKAMVQQGLDSRIQQALDIVRVIGNECVHPGTIDMKDDNVTARKILELVNMIATRTISEPKEVERLFEALPQQSLAAIEKRDARQSPDGQPD